MNEDIRTKAQNRLMMSCLTDLSKQLQWNVDGRMQWLHKLDWKDIMSAGLRRHQRMALGIDGGFVLLGQRTSLMIISEMSELVTICHAFGDERGVKWSRTSLGRDVPDEACA
ncbi:MAG: recombination protein NinB [Burkholderiaceae bacterium]|nr:recombination protein NinB [Burkholderiaceae bacterium]